MSFTITYSIKAVDNFSKTLDAISKNFTKINAKLNGHNRSLNTAGQHVQKLHTRYNKLFKAQNTNFKKLKSNFKGHTLLAKSSLSSINNKVLQIGQSSETAGATISGMTKGLKTDNLDATYTKLGDISNMAGAVGGKFNLMSKLGGIAAVGAIGAFSVKSIAQASELKAFSMRLAPFVRDPESRTIDINQIRDLSVKTGQNVKDLTESLRLFLESNYTEKEALVQTKQLTDISAFTGSQITEIASIFTGVQRIGRAGAETFMMLSGRGINLYPEIAKTMGIKYDPRHQQYQQIMLNKMIATKPILPEQFKEMLTEYMQKKGITGMAEQITQQTMLGKWRMMTSAISDITTSFGKLTASSNTLNVVFTGAAGVLDKVAGGMRKMADSKGFIAKSLKDFNVLSMVPVIGPGLIGLSGHHAPDNFEGMKDAPLIYDFKSLMSNFEMQKDPLKSESHVKIDLAAEGFTHKSSYMRTDAATKLDIGINDDRL